MIRGDERRPPLADIDRPAQGRDAHVGAGRMHLVGQRRSEGRPFDRRGDPPEALLRRRARRQAVALMLLSAAISMLAIYGAWALIRGR